MKIIRSKMETELNPFKNSFFFVFCELTVNENLLAEIDYRIMIRITISYEVFLKMKRFSTAYLLNDLV